MKLFKKPTIKLKKPDIKGSIEKLKHMNKEDWKEYWKKRKERRQRILAKRRESKFAKMIAPYVHILNRFSLFFHAVLACLINFIIEVMSRHSLLETWNYMVESPLVFLYNASLIFITFSVVYLVRRRSFARIIIGVLWLVLGFCNGYMLLVRVTPFNAQDLKVATDAVTLINSYFTPVELVLVIVGTGAVIVWLISMWRRGQQYDGKMHRIIAGIACVAWLAGFLCLTNLAIDKRVVSNYFGNIAFAYEDYGLPYCFMSSVFNTGISEPNGYNEENMMAITNNGEMASEVEMKKKEKPNIIFVQLESFFDPSESEFFTTSSDACPNFTKWSKSFTNGYFKVPSVGAGTANTEFEVLTGMNMRYFGPGEYPYKTILKEKTAESAATALDALGYGTHALHNNGGNFYSRSTVYNHMGFDTFISKEFMNILQFTPQGWAKDEILVQHIMDSMDTTEQQDFVFAVSVQGHGSYPEEKVLEDPVIKVEGIEDEGLKNSWEYYVNQVYEMDQFAGNLVDAVKKRKEPTVIVFYGDHLPTMGLETSDVKSRYLYNTNYVIWDNIGLKEKDRNVASYQIMADVFESLNIHSGTVFNYHQERHQTKNYLQDLELLQYDLLYGNQYAYKEEQKVPEIGHMFMGVKDVTLTEIVSQLDSTYSLYGTNFTQWSRVYINGERQSVVFLNNTRVNLTDCTLNEGDIITVSQVGSSNTVFRTSAEYRYTEGKLVQISEPNADQGVSWQDTKESE